jgi:purine-nucleoside phosphorylase
MDSAATADDVGEAAQFLRRHFGQVDAALVLGTGSGLLAERIAQPKTLPFAEVPHFPRATAPEHAGRLVCGELAGLRVLVMQGRCHLYEGFYVEQVTLPIRAAQRLGARLLLMTNAAGGLNPQFRTGEIIVVTDHIDLTFRGSGKRAIGDTRGETVAQDRPVFANRKLYDASLADSALAVARRLNIAAHAGVYVGVTGPNYETRAEYRFLRRIGADAVGMSTVWEARAAAQLGMRVAALSVITNVAQPERPERVDAKHVIAAAQSVAPKLGRLVLELLDAAKRDPNA